MEKRAGARGHGAVAREHMRMQAGFVFAVVGVLAAGACTGTGSRSESRAAISGRVVLERDMAGANDMSRVRVDLGRGEGGITPDESGEFTVSDLEPDVYTVTVTYIGGLTADAQGSAYQRLEQRVVARAGGSIVLGDLRPLLGRAPVTGRLVLPGGAMPTDGEVELVPTDAVDRTPVRGVLVNGAFTVADVPVGRHLLVARGTTFALERASTTCGAEVRVAEGRDTPVEIPDTSVVATTVGLSPGAGEVPVQQGNTWYLEGNSVTVRVDSAYARRVRTWRSEEPAPAWVELPEDGISVRDLPEGRTTLLLQFADRCDFESTVFTLVLVNDSTPPAVAPPVLDDGGRFIRSAQANLQVLATDTASTELQMRMQLCDVSAADVEACTPATLADAPWAPYEVSRVVAFNATAGRKRARVEVRDLSGNVAAARVVDARLDMAPPQGTLFINGGMDAEAARSPLLDVTLSSTDDESGPVAAALGDVQLDCNNAAYVFPPSGVVGFGLGAGEGLRGVYACFMDAAGRVTAAPVESSNRVTLDTVAPVAPVVRVGAGNGWIRTSTVPVTVTTTDDNPAQLSVHVDGASVAGAPLPMDADGSITFDVDLGAGDGPRALFVTLVDGAGNRSVTAQVGVELDTVPPGTPLVLVSGQRSPDGSRVLTVNTAVIPITLADTDGRTMKVYERAGASCGEPTCDGTEVPFSAQSTFALSPTTGTKHLCARVCDAAGNGAVGTAQVTLGTFVPRPRPVLTAITPRGILVGESTPITVTGSGMASDTFVQVGDFTAPCTFAAPAPTACSVSSPSSCAGTCTLAANALPRGVLDRAGSYAVRLVTPDPVQDGLNTAAATLFLDVVAAVPRITWLSPRGITAPSNLSGTTEFQVCGSGMADNSSFSLLTSTANVLAAEGTATHPECPAGSNRWFRISFPNSVLRARTSSDADLVVRNPSPGGGEHRTPLGLNPAEQNCPSGLPCVGNLRGTRARTADGAGVHQSFVPGGDNPAGVYAWSGATHAALRGEDGRLLARVDRQHGGAALPRLLGGGAVRVDLEDRQGTGPAVALRTDVFRGNGRFDGARNAEVDVTAPVDAMDVADVTGDGFPDLVVITAGQRLLRVYPWMPGDPADPDDADGFSSSAIVTALDGEPFGVAVADIVLDGRPDVVLHVRRGNGDAVLRVMQGLGDGRFGESTEAPAPAPEDDVGQVVRASRVRVADMDGDSVPDVVLSARFNAFRTLDLYRARADGELARFTQPNIPTLSGFTNADVAVGDLDMDGRPDVAVPGVGLVRVAWNEGGGVFTAADVAVDAAGSGRDMAAVAVTDVNGDGAPDLVAAGGHMPGPGAFHDVRVVTSTGARTFSGHVVVASYAASSNLRSLSVGDVDGDGHADVLVGTNNQSQLLLRDVVVTTVGTSAWRTVSNPPVAATAWNQQLLDVDGDGTLDIVAAGASSVSQDGNKVFLYRGVRAASSSGPGRTQSFDVGVFNGVFTQASPFTNGVTGDFNRDGRPDVFVSGNGLLHYSMLLQADGTWTGTRLNGGGLGAWMAATDLDLDGNTDVVQVRNLNQGNNIVDLFAGNADGTFGGAQFILDTGVVGSALQLADFTGDGRPDLAVIGSDGSVRVFPRDPVQARRFSTTPVVSALTGARSPVLEAADVNGDGILDVLATTDYPNAAVHIGLGTGTGAFTMGGSFPVTAPTGPSPVSVVAGDINGDGRVDVVVAADDVFSATESLWQGLQDAAGMFTFTRVSDSVSNRLQLVDVNGDGLRDVVGYLRSSGTLSTWLSGSAGLTARSDDVVVTHPDVGERFPPMLVDLDGDAAVDVIHAPARDTLAQRMLPGPSSWRQELLDMPAASVTVAAGASSDLHVHQVAQVVERLGVRVRLSASSAAGLERVRLELVSPSGTTVVLDDGDPATTCDNKAAVARWLGAYPTTPSCGTLAALEGAQPSGEWTLRISNNGMQAVSVEDWAVTTYGAFRQRFAGSDRPDVLRLGRGGGAVVDGTTQGFAALPYFSPCGNFMAPAHQYTLNVGAADDLAFRVVADGPASVSVTPGACDGSMAQLACGDGTTTGPVSLAAGPHCVVVRGSGASPGALNYRLHVAANP